MCDIPVAELLLTKCAGEISASEIFFDRPSVSEWSTGCNSSSWIPSDWRSCCWLWSNPWQLDGAHWTVFQQMWYAHLAAVVRFLYT